MTLQEIINTEIQKGKLKHAEIYLPEVDLKCGLMHHEWCYVRRVGMPFDPFVAVVMITEFSVATIHVIDLKLICRLDELYKQDLEFDHWVEDQ